MPHDNEVAVENNVAAGRFEIHLDDQIAFLQYDRQNGEITILHTEVPQALGGRGLGNLLAKTALEWARAEGLRVIVLCPFVRTYLRKHPLP
jgi:predicted GNAT family acetyltransferase